MKTEEWYEIRTKLGAMFSDYLVNKITYAEIENQVIGWIEEASKKPVFKIEFDENDLETKT